MEFHLSRYLYLTGWSAALAGALALQGCAPGFGSVAAYEPDQSPAPALSADGMPAEGGLVPISPGSSGRWPMRGRRRCRRT